MPADATSRERLAAQARDCGWFVRVVPPYVREDAERLVAGWPAATKILGKYRRGGGYWIWKPLIICEALATLREGQVSTSTGLWRSRSHPHVAVWSGGEEREGY